MAWAGKKLLHFTFSRTEGLSYEEEGKYAFTFFPSFFFFLSSYSSGFKRLKVEKAIGNSVRNSEPFE
jgi:hypothetical protein